MAGKVNVYNLGERGVNVTKSPIHMEDGELRSAQNGIFDPSLAEGGISKRFGMPRFNGSALAGAVRGIIDVPLPAPGSIARTLYLALDTAGANTWGSSADGVTWAYGTTLARAQSTDQVFDSGSVYYNQRSASFRRKLYYAGEDYIVYPIALHSGPPIRVFDGVNDYELFRVPYNPAAGSATSAYFITDFCVHDSKLYFAVSDPGGGAPDQAGRVFEFDPDTSIVTQVGNAFGNGADEVAGGMPYCLCSHNGMLWAGTYGISGASVGTIHAIRPGIDLTWTLKVTTAPAGAGYIMSMASYDGELYYGTQGDAGSAALLRKLSNTGTLSTIDTAPATDAGNYFGGLIVYDGDLYASWSNIAGAAALIRKWDGTSMSTDRDVGSLDTVQQVGQPFVHDNVLYMPWVATSAAVSDGFLLRKAAGAWTKPVTNVNVRGFFGRVDLLPSS